MKTYSVTIESQSAEAILEFAGLAQARGLTVRHDLAVEYEQPAEPVRRTPVTSGAVAAKPIRSPVTSGTPNLDEAWTELMGSINAAQWNVLRVIKAHPEGVTSRGLAKELGEPVNSITGYIGGGLRKNIPNARFQYEQIIITEGKKPNSVYRPGTILLSRELPKHPPSNK